MKNKYEAGITLIALVITIIIMLILAGVGITVLLGENGIITKARTTKEIQKIAEITEKLEIEKGPVGIDNLGIVSLNNYLNHIKTKNIITDENILPIIEGVEITDDCYILVENKYKYLLEEEENGNLKITYLGIPLILKLETDIKTNSITVKTIIEKQFQDKEKYTFYIKTNKTEEYQKVAEQEENGEYTYTRLSQGITYYIKVEVETKEGRKDSKQIAIKTGEIPGINVGDIIFDTTPEGWTKGNKQTTINSRIDGYELQYQKDVTSETIKDDSKWIKYEGAITSEKNESIYVRLWDGINAGSTYAIQNVTGIDKIPPNNFTISSNNVTTKSFVVSGTATDGAATSEYGSSGIKNYTYYFKKSTDAAYTNAVQTGTSKTYSNLTSGTYNVYVVVADNAGNIKQSNTINVTLGSVIGISGATYTPTAWTNGNVTVTLPKATGYTTQYQIGGIGGTWLNYANPFAITTNSTIYYRYNDGINAGNYASVNITNIDKTPPSKTTVNLNGYVSGTTTTANVTQTASATDNVKVAYYQYSHDGVNVAGTFPNPWTINYDGSWNFYVRAVDHVGNIGAWSDRYTIIRISTVPLSSKARPGDYVKYVPRATTYVSPVSLNGYANQTFNTSSYTDLWQVLYNDSTRGLQIVSVGSIGSIVIYGKTGYNNVVTTFNQLSEQYMDGKYAIAARHAGTDPANPAGPTGTANVNGQIVTTWDRTSHITDVHAMTAATSQNAGGIVQIGVEYLLCSRQKYTDSYGSVMLGVTDSRAPVDTNPSDKVPLNVHSNGSISQNAITSGVRPIITLNNNTPVTGAGTASNPYVIR